VRERERERGNGPPYSTHISELKGPPSPKGEGEEEYEK